MSLLWQAEGPEQPKPDCTARTDVSAVFMFTSSDFFCSVVRTDASAAFMFVCYVCLHHQSTCVLPQCCEVFPDVGFYKGCRCENFIALVTDSI